MGEEREPTTEARVGLTGGALHSALRTAHSALPALCFLLGAPALAHGLFSWMGFNPADEGFILAYSRRLLDGQVPHLDFISIRPVGSAILHAPEVLLGGEATLWLSRLVAWFQAACVAWLWSGILPRMWGVPTSRSERVALALAGMMLSCHDFPMMAWHTTDGIFLSTLGIALLYPLSTVHRPLPTVQLLLGSAGAVLLGMAALCKQNFAAMVPIAVVALGQWRRVRPWAWAAAPGVGYAAFVLAAGAWSDAWVQLTSRSDLAKAGGIAYVTNGLFFAGVALGWVASWMAGRAAPLVRALGSLALLAVPVAFMAANAQGAHFHWPSFLLFGAVLGMALGQARRPEAAKRGWAVALVLGLGWTASLSVGYNSPMLVAGPMGVLMMCAALGTPRSPLAAPRSRRFLLLAVLAAITVAFVAMRRGQVYLDRPAAELSEPLAGVFPGAKHLYTNPRTYAALVDLQAAIARARRRGKAFAIVPDFASYWVKAPERNPLPIDWPQGTELDSPRVLQRVFDSLDAQRGRIVVLVAKPDIRFVAGGIEPPPNPKRLRVASYVRERFTRTGETAYFELYEWAGASYASEILHKPSSCGGNLRPRKANGGAS